VALGGFGEQGNWMAVSYHPVELEHHVLEIDVLEKEATFSRHLLRPFGDRTRQQSTQRIDPWSKIGIDWYGVPQTRDMLKAYADKITEQMATQEKQIAQLEARLANKSYVDNAPKEVVQQTKDQLEEAKESMKRLETERTRFQSA